MTKIIDIELIPGMSRTRALIYDFLDLPYHRKIQICHELGSNESIVSVFGQAAQDGKLDKLAKMIESAKVIE